MLRFDGVDKLDSGDKLIWRVSQKVATPDTSPWGAREAFIGLAGENWGTFRAGRIFTPSYLALDQFQWGAGNLWEDYGAGAVWFKEALAYSSPEFYGLGFQVMYDLGNKTPNGQAWAVDTIATYKYKPLGLSFAGGYQQQKGVGNTACSSAESANTPVPDVPTGCSRAGGVDVYVNQDDAFQPSSINNDVKQQMYFLQGNWEMGNGVTLRAGYKNNKWSTAGGAKAENQQYLVAGAYTWGKSQLALGWQDIVQSKANGRYDGLVGGNSDASGHNANQFFGQYTYNLSKQTSAYLQARYMKFGNADQRPYYAAPWQLDGVASSGTDNGARVLIGTWTGF
jgi:predicted porin